MKLKAFQVAFPYTIPVLIGFLFMGASYGLLMNSMGFSFVYSFFMSVFVFGGSLQFVAISLLLGPFAPLQAFILALVVSARHIFYGISMLDKYKGIGPKRYYMMFGMCDETFSIHCAATPPDSIDRGWFLFFVTLLDHIYWITGATLGGILGHYIKFNTKGLEFVMTALFTVIFIEQWEERRNRIPALIGLGCAGICLFIFGSQSFMIPAMIAIITCFTIAKAPLSRKVGS